MTAAEGLKKTMESSNQMRTGLKDVSGCLKPAEHVKEEYPT